jgi:uncharacterized protein with NRDE domain
MCTVTAVPRSWLSSPAWTADPLLLRLTCNRDELRTRAEALAPVLQSVEGRRVVMPLDPESGGSWIAVNDTGLVFALLNANPPSPHSGRAFSDGMSRGGLIPRLVAATSMTQALARLEDAQAERYRPFRLLMFDASQFVECWVDAGRMRHRRAYLQGPVMRTSSSLGDAVVEGPRRTLFRRFFRAVPHAAAAQDAFHEHQWPGREDVSVQMQRPDALTVSRTTIEVSTSFVTMIYRATCATVYARVVLPLAGQTALARARCS